MNTSHSATTGTPAKAQIVAARAPTANGRSMNEPGVVSSPRAKTNVAPSHSHCQDSGSSMSLPPADTEPR
jgi:hypothetical protein